MMKLMFPELGGGKAQGLNDAGVENFQGAIDVYISRECGQNSGDAPREGVKTVRLEFDRISMHPNEIPGFEQLRLALKASLEKWQGKDEQIFFKEAIELAEKDSISVLKISDYGTTGLWGDDLDDRGRWFGLVKSDGVSNKEDTAGGSFGIGKSSPYAASRFRTVFYGTRTEEGNVAFQGVSRLVTHKNPDGKLTQGTGYIGEYDPQGGEGGEPVFRAIRNNDEIPAAFRRQETGTDIWVIGYRSGGEWRDDLIKSILSNFWPAIHRGTIQFRVGSENISQSNLADLIGLYIGEEDFEAHHFYKAVLNQPIKKTLKHTGSAELYLTTTTPDLPRAVCMVRSAGMRIFDFMPRSCRVPYSGLFICTDNDGNKLLRKMEPPKHNIWDPKRIEGSSGKKALDEIKLWIREEVRKLNPLYAGSSFNENEIAKYVPDATQDEPNDLPDEKTGDTGEESLEPKPAAEKVFVKPLRADPVAVHAGGEFGGGSRQNTEGGSSGGGGSGEGGGEGNGEGGEGDGTDENAKGGGKADDTTQPRITARSYRSGVDQYELVLRSETNCTGNICVYAMGEDGAREQVELQSARYSRPSGAALLVMNGMIQNVQLEANVRLPITLKLNAIERRSLTVGIQK